MKLQVKRPGNEVESTAESGVLIMIIIMMMIITMTMTMIMIMIMISNINWTEWSTIQGVIARVTSKSDEREARGRFEITSTITP